MTSALSSKPLKYQQVRDALERHVATLAPGTRLPSERALAGTFDCNVLTVRKGMAALVEHGILVRRAGSGTFVAAAELPPHAPVPSARPRPRRVGMLVLSSADDYARQLLACMAPTAADLDIELRSRWVQSFGEEAVRQARELAEEGCASLTLPWFPSALSGEVARFVPLCPVPVSLPRLIPGFERNCFEQPELFGVGIVKSTQALCHYFRSLGLGHIALLGPATPGDEILQRNLSAYTCYTYQARLPQLCGLVGSTASDMDDVAGQWRRHAGDLAVISYDDTHAMRFITAMHKLGLAAPADYRVVGFNNVDAGRFSDPPLSSVDHDFRYASLWLLRSAIGLARGELDRSPTVSTHRLIVRESCGGAGRDVGELAGEMRPHGLVVTPDPGARASVAVGAPAL